MRRLAATAAALALAFAAGCGDEEGGEPIPRESASDLLTVLDLVERQVEAGACRGAESKVRQDLQPKLDQLPRAVDPEVRSALQDGADRLLELIADECGADEPTDTTETETQPTETQPTETQPTEMQPTETETTPPPTETQPPPTETQPPPPPDDTPPDGRDMPPDGGDGGAQAPDGGAGRAR